MILKLSPFRPTVAAIGEASLEWPTSGLFATVKQTQITCERGPKTKTLPKQVVSKLYGGSKGGKDSALSLALLILSGGTEQGVWRWKECMLE